MAEMRWVVLAGALAALSASGATARGDDKGDAKAEAKNHFDVGLALFKAEKYDAAAIELETSVKLYPNKGGLFNLASVYKVLSRYDEALDALSRLETEHAETLDEEMRAAARHMRDEITRLAARIEVAVEPSGASVTVDGREVGTSPLSRPVLVDPGEHVVRAAMAGHLAAEATVRVISQEEIAVGLSLESEAGAAATETEKSKESERKKLGLTPFVVAGALAVGAGAATIALGVKADAKEEEGLAAHDQSMIDEARPLQIAGRVTLGLTLGAGVAAVVLAFFTDFEKGRRESPVAMGISPNGAVLMGRF